MDHFVNPELYVTHHKLSLVCHVAIADTLQ